jgi:hypothetical protein
MSIPWRPDPSAQPRPLSEKLLETLLFQSGFLVASFGLALPALAVRSEKVGINAWLDGEPWREYQQRDEALSHLCLLRLWCTVKTVALPTCRTELVRMELVR